MLDPGKCTVDHRVDRGTARLAGRGSALLAGESAQLTMGNACVHVLDRGQRTVYYCGNAGSTCRQCKFGLRQSMQIRWGLRMVDQRQYTYT